MIYTSKETIQCPECDSNHVVKVGFYPTKKLGKRQRYRCEDCASTFYLELKRRYSIHGEEKHDIDRTKVAIGEKNEE